MKRTLIPELHDLEARQALAEAVTALLDRWRLQEEDRAALLGLPDGSALSSYRQGAALADDRELLERVGHLLAIDRELRKVYPDAPGFRTRWFQTRDPGLDKKSPLEVVRQQGVDGLRALRRHLEAG